MNQNHTAMNNLKTKITVRGLINNSSMAMLILCLLSAFNLSAQVAINETDAAPAAGAELDISSTTKGVIFPVMTQVQRDAIPGPAAGLIIFNITGGYPNYYNGTNWVQINRTLATLASNPVGAGTDVGVGVGVADPDNSAILHVNSTTKGFLLPRISGVPSTPSAGMIYYNTGSNQIFFYTTAWDQLNFTVSSAGAGGASTAAGVLIGTGTITASAKMEVKTSTAKGLLIPRMTSAQRNAIVSPAEGLTLYNITDAKIQFFLGNTWYNWSSASNNYGQVVGNPGLSCKDIYNNNPGTNAVDGTYFINPNGSTYQCHCDMTRDGGGWTLVENTGPKGTQNNVSGASGVTTPISTSNSGAFAKLDDVDINLLRGGAPGYATSILKVERQNSCQPTQSIYFKQNRVLNSTAANNSQSINNYHTTYANAVGDISLQSGTSNYGSAFDSWSGGTSGYQIIFRYGGEGFITNGCNSTTGCTANNRSECNVLLWVK